MLGEALAMSKIIIYGITGGVTVLVSIIAFLLKRELNRNKDAQDVIHENIKDIRHIQDSQVKITSEHDKNIAVMNAEKVGRPELKEEMDKIQQGFDDKLATFRDDIKEDIRELKEIVIKAYSR